jgi:hypothetical protein
MAAISDLKDGIAVRLATIAGLRVHAFQPDRITPPMATVFPDRVEFDLNARRGADTFFFVVQVIVGRADDRAAQRNLDAYIGGSLSVKAAIEGDRTLAGKANTLRVTEMRNYQQVLYGDTLYLGCEFEVEVVA